MKNSTIKVGLAQIAPICLMATDTLVVVQQITATVENQSLTMDLDTLRMVR